MHAHTLALALVGRARDVGRGLASSASASIASSRAARRARGI
jgi:mevalonate kinase